MNVNQQTPYPSQASAWLKQGKLLAYPTESIWGIGCNPFDKHAVYQILKIKNRPVEKGMIVITDQIERIIPFLQTLNTTQQQKVINSWQRHQQQATTWLLPIPYNLSVKIPLWITGTHSKLAIRVINHTLIQKLCKMMVSKDNPYGFIVSTSCNPSEQTPAHDLYQAYHYFGNEIFYLQGDTLGYQKPSQIFDVLTGEVLR